MTSINDFIDDVTARHLPQARAAVVERDAKIAAINQQMEPLKAARDDIQKQLADARANLANIPATAEPSDISNWMVITERWPGRIAKLNGELNELTASTRTATDACNHQVNHVAAEIKLEFMKARELIREPPNLWRLLI